jgi:hypothetical protein
LPGFAFSIAGKPRDVELGDEVEALPAQREQAQRQREQPVPLDGELLDCDRCGATWRKEAIVEASTRHPVCLLCGGHLTPVP